MKKRLLIKNKLARDSWETVLPFFVAQPFDEAAYRAYVDADFEDGSELKAVMTKLGVYVAQSEAGVAIDVSDIKLLQAKQLLSMLATCGRLRAARQMLEASKQNWNPGRFGAHDALLLDEKDNNGVMTEVDEVWKDFQVIDRGADTTFMLFCGVAARFGVELNIMMQWLKVLPVNVIYVRDFSHLLYLQGIKSLGSEAESVVRIRAALEKIGTKKLVCIGNSGGCFGALYYGHLLQADEIVCFSGPTTLEAGVQEKADRPVYERIHELVSQGEIVEPDVVGAYEKNGIKVRYILGEHSEFDQIQASRIAHIPTVSIEPLEGWDGHFVLGELARREMLAAIFAEAAEPKACSVNKDSRDTL